MAPSGPDQHHGPPPAPPDEAAPRVPSPAGAGRPVGRDARPAADGGPLPPGAVGRRPPAEEDGPRERPRTWRERAGRAWADQRAALRRTPVSMWRDDVSDWAAALTYYAILTLLPTLLVTVSLIGLISRPATDALIEHVTAWAPAESGPALHRALRGMAGERSAALTVVIGGIVSAVWSASSYLAVFRRALHAMYGVEDRRPALRKAHRILVTAVTLLVLLMASAVALVVSGPVAQAMTERVGLGAAGTAAWSWLRWPALLCLVLLLVLVVFRTGPALPRGLRHTVPGGVLAAVLWLAASFGFTAYASGLGTYSRLYGSLAGAVVFLVWLWFSNLSLLAGAQFAAELRAGRRPGPAAETGAGERGAGEAGPGVSGGSA